MVSSLVVLATVLALASAASPKDVGGDKMAAVNKVAALLDGLSTKVVKEGAAEKKSYDKFALFCTDGKKDKGDDITSGSNAVNTLSSTITVDIATRDRLDKQAADLVALIGKTEKDGSKATNEDKAAAEEYAINAADLQNAITGVAGAIKVMSVNKAATPAFLQMPFSQDMRDTIESAALMADALGLVSGSDVTALLQGSPESLVATSSSVEKIDPYAFRGNSIISAMTTLQTDFKAQKVKLDATETARKAAHALVMKNGGNTINSKKAELDRKRKASATTSAKISVGQSDKKSTAAQLADDKSYLKELTKICADKATTYAQRKDLRTKELAALKTATDIMKGNTMKRTAQKNLRLLQHRLSAASAEFTVHNEDAMDAIEAAIEEEERAPLAFFQQSSVSPHFGEDALDKADRELQGELDDADRKQDKDDATIATQASEESPKEEESSPVSQESVEDDGDGRQAVMNLLRTKATVLHSTALTSLASQLSNPLGKVQTLVQSLIDKLLTEANAEANQKGWCDKSIGDATQKSDYYTEDIAELNADIEQTKAEKSRLVAQLKTLAEEISKLNRAQGKADFERKTEKGNNAQSVADAKAGLAAVKLAIKTLEEFYKASAKADAKLDSSMAAAAKAKGEAKAAETNSVDTHMSRSAVQKNMPDAGFGGGEGYTGSQGEASGIIGMLEVIESDFTRTVRNTEEAETKAADDHLEFSTKTKSSLAEKSVATIEKTRRRNEASKELSDPGGLLLTLADKQKLLAGKKKELEALKTPCSPPSQTYAERCAARDKEVTALKQSLEMFENRGKR